MINDTRRQLLVAALLGGIGVLSPIAARSQTIPNSSDGAADKVPWLDGNHRVIIDTDPGSDDALAMLMVLGAPNLKTEAVTVCAGNVQYDQEVKNAFYILQLAGKTNIPVHRGLTRPLLNLPYPSAGFIHGAQGLDSAVVPAPTRLPDPEHAALAISRIVKQYPGEVVLLALGGLSNIATALLLDPTIAQNAKGIIIVGGRYSAVGTKFSYNVLVDPEATHIVLTSGIPIAMCGGLGQYSLLTKADFDHIATFETTKSKFFLEANQLRYKVDMEKRGKKGATFGDPLAVAIAIDPKVGVRFSQVYMSVVLSGEETRGLLIFGGKNEYTGEPTPPPNVSLCIEASGDDFKRIVFDTLRQT
ncbi:hypothetical protein GOC54_32865 [Sinorhizobium meliloti]|nr:hypothetical protein [Sinorhizobium meliloti]